MSNVVIFDAPTGVALLPQSLIGLGNALNKSLAGGGINRISLKGNRFRFIKAGEQVAVASGDFPDVVIAGAVPTISRVYYKKAFDNSGGDNGPPVCYSTNGVTPDAKVPADQRQHSNCAGCKQNVKGSKIVDGRQMRACSFRQRVVVIDPAKLENGSAREEDIYALDINASSIFGSNDAAAGTYSLQGYTKWLAEPRSNFTNGISHLQVVTRMAFDIDADVPSKLAFSVATNGANRAAFLDSDAIATLGKLVTTETYKRLLESSASELVDDEVGGVAVSAVLTWQDVARAAGADDDDIEGIEDAGGPHTEKGRKRWAKAVPEGVTAPGEVAQAAPAQAPVQAPPPPPPAPPILKPWKEAAKEVGVDDDDIESIEEAGGPSTEKGLLRWTKYVKLPLDGIDMIVKTRAKAKAKVKETVAAVVQTAPAAPAATEKPVAALNEGVGNQLADALSAFDDE